MPFQRCCVNAPPHVHRVVHGGSTRVSRIRPHCLLIELVPIIQLTDLPIARLPTLHHLSLMVNAEQIRDAYVVKRDTVWVQPEATVLSTTVRLSDRQLTLGGWGRASGVNAGHCQEAHRDVARDRLIVSEFVEEPECSRQSFFQVFLLHSSV
jgi:hypothetical protein